IVAKKLTDYTTRPFFSRKFFLEPAKRSIILEGLFSRPSLRYSDLRRIQSCLPKTLSRHHRRSRPRKNHRSPNLPCASTLCSPVQMPIPSAFSAHIQSPQAGPSASLFPGPPRPASFSKILTSIRKKL